VKARFTGRGPATSTAIVLVIAVVVSLATVLGLPAGHPVRVVAGLALFVVLPGVGVEVALLRPQASTPPWERLALIGALGLAASALASVILVVVGVAITETSVGAACASIAVIAAIISVIGGRSRAGSTDHTGTIRLALTLGLIVSGGVIGSTIGSGESGDQFTILALEDPAGARADMDASMGQGGSITVRVVVESHEAGVEVYQLLVVGGALPRTFSLQPNERRVLELEVTGESGSVEIQLLRSGQPYRSLRISARGES
jgi:uncharacterized membrane protein